tara:strand:+ start:485 stop:1012 length:528 start_codon:yes stop_codon:yes gene_type:complete
MATNLQFIKQVINTSGRITTLNISDCFPSKYKIFQVFCDANCYTDIARQVDVRLLDSGGNVISDSEYAYARLQLRSNASFNENKSSSDTNWDRPFCTNDNNPEPSVGILTLYNPNDATSYTFATSQGASMNGTGSLRGAKFIGVHKSTEEITGLQIFNSDSAMDTGTKLTVYGVK